MIKLILVLLVVVAIGVIGWKILNAVLNGTNKESKIVDGLADRYKERKEQKMVSKTYTVGPLGITQGSNIRLSGEAMLRIIDSKRLISLDKDTFKVSALGRLKFDTIDVHRVYLDDDATFLQFAVDENGSVLDVVIYSRVLSKTVENEVELDYFMNPYNGINGNKTFLLDSTDGEVVFDRITPPYNGSNTHVSPTSTLETIIDEAGNTYIVHNDITIYERHIGSDFSEFALLQKAESESSVDLETYVGTPIEDESEIEVN